MNIGTTFLNEKAVKSIILYINFCFILISCQGKEIGSVTYSTLNQKNDSLITVYYNRATSLKGEEKVKNERLFFDAFPNNFKDFSLLYGFEENPMQLYDVGFKHLTLLDNMNSIPQKDYYSKYINLAIGGTWQADNISDFQSSLYNKVYSNPSLTTSILEKYSQADIKSFWHFLFDGPHPEDKQIKESFEKLYKKINSLNKEMAETMKDEYAKLIKSSDGHGR